VDVSVRDTGEGIRAEDLPHVFERFYRGEKSRNRGTGGAGLGLAIARGIVRAHGGDIWVESEAGKGTQFTFSIP
jgi:signal transduction histidine kinase